MTGAERTRYWEWCARQWWQYQRRSAWTYEWRGQTLVRYVENVPADPEFAAGLIDYLLTDESVHGYTEADGTERGGATVYNRPARLGEGWKSVGAWFEQQTDERVQASGQKYVRVYQSLQRIPEGGEGDGPYLMENGCRYRVTFTYHWKVAELPTPPQGASGVSYRLTGVTRDDETGLWSCILERRERVEQSVEEYRSAKTAFSETFEEQHIGVRKESLAATGKAASAGGGTTVRRRVTKNEDCTYDVANETERDIAVAGAAVTVTRTLRTKTTTVEDRNMENPLATESLEVGESVTNERTASGRYRRRKTETVAATPDGPIAESCAKTAFEHRDAQTTVTADNPGATCVEEAAGGVTRTARVRRTEDGAYERDVETRTEMPVADAIVEVRRTARGTRTTTVSRSQGSAGSASGLKSGEQVRSEKTAGGLWDVTKSEVKVPDGGQYIQRSCGRTALSHVDRSTMSVEGWYENELHAPEATGDGRIYTREIRRNEEGGYDSTTTLDMALPVTDEAAAGTAMRTERTVRYANAKEIAVPAPTVNVEVSAQVRTNDHGVKDGVVTVTEHTPQTLTVETSNPLYDETVTAGAYVTEEDDEDGGRGKVVSKSASPNEVGSRTVRKTVRSAKPAATAAEWTTKDDDYTYTHAVLVYRNQEEMPEIPQDRYRCSVSVSINEYGLYDVVITTVQRSGGGSGAGQSQSSQGTEYRWLTYQRKDGKMYRRKVSAHYLMRRESGGNLHTCMLDDAESGYGFNSHDNGSFGIKYTNIAVGAEEEV